MNLKNVWNNEPQTLNEDVAGLLVWWAKIMIPFLAIVTYIDSLIK
jgi:hypothetical protein